MSSGLINGSRKHDNELSGFINYTIKRFRTEHTIIVAKIILPITASQISYLEDS